MGDMSGYENYIDFKGWHNTFVINRQLFSIFKSEFRGKVLAGKEVLEIGFGDGSFMRWAESQGAIMTGLERQRELVLQGIEKGYDVVLEKEFCWGGVNQKFDYICGFDVIEHIPEERIPEFLKKISDSLKENGFCILRFPNAASPFGIYYQNSDITHVTSLSERKLVQYCLPLGLTVTRVRPAHIGWKHQNRRLDFLVVMYNLFVIPLRRAILFGISVIFLGKVENLDGIITVELVKD